MQSILLSKITGTGILSSFTKLQWNIMFVFWSVHFHWRANWSFCVYPHMKWMIHSGGSFESYFLSNAIRMLVYIKLSQSVLVTKALHSSNVIQPKKNVLVTILFHTIRDAACWVRQWLQKKKKKKKKKNCLHRKSHV